MKLRELPWGKIALFGGLALLMTSSNTVVFREEWKLARQLHPQAQYRFLALLQAIEAHGYRVVLTSAYRPGQESFHGFGLALDLNIIHVATGKWFKMATDKATWEATGVPAIIRAHGFRWGGDFVTQWAAGRPAYDPVHVDLGAVYAMADLRAAALRLAGSAAALGTFDRRKVLLAA